MSGKRRDGIWACECLKGGEREKRKRGKGKSVGRGDRREERGH